MTEAGAQQRFDTFLSGTVKGLAIGVCLTWFVFAAIGAYCLIMH